MRRRAFLGMAAAGIGAACGPAAREGKRPLQSMKVMAYYAPSTSGLYLARSHGYFRDVGLEVQVEPLMGIGTPQAMPALVSGRVEAAMFGLSSLFVNAVARGAKPRTVAARETLGPDCSVFGTLVGRRESFPDGLADLRVLRGKTVALPPEASMREFFVDVLFEHVGLTRADVKPGPLGREAPSAFRAGKIDAMFAPEEMISRQLKGDYVVSHAVAELLEGFPVQLIYFGEALLAPDDDRGVRFLAAFFRGLELYRQGEYPKELKEYLNVKNADSDRALGICSQSFAPGGRIDLAKLRLFAEWCFKKGYCNRRVEPEEMVNLRFLEAAARLAEKAGRV